MFRSFFKKYSSDYQRFTGTYELVKGQAIHQVNKYRRLQEEMMKTQPDNIALYGSKIYSQTDEDGIIEEIFNRIPHNKSFFEIGIQTGVECNTLYLLLKKWKGIWIEGNKEDCATIKKDLNGNSFPNKLNIINSFITKENIADHFRKAHEFLGVSEIDFFSLDIDGNDYYIMEEILKQNIFPKVICVEYNAKFAPPIKMKIKYNKEQVWDYSDYIGCSLQTYVDLFQRYNYTLVCCNLTGINAFFVKNEFVKLFTVYSAEELYQPYRFYLSPIVLPQKPSLKYLRDLLEELK